MALKDTFKGLFQYFEIDEQPELDRVPEETRPVSPQMRVASVPKEPSISTIETRRQYSRSQVGSAPKAESLRELHERQQELLGHSSSLDGESRATIDIKFPKRYEDAPEIVNLLLGNASVLIDFQYMSDAQARRCLDYLDGARSVLLGNLKKVSNTMWLLTPVNVTVNIEELRMGRVDGMADTSFDYDVRR